MFKHLGVIAIAATFSMAAEAAGPFFPATDLGLPGISMNDSSFVQWATGYINYLPGPNVDSTFKTPEKALGRAAGNSFDIVSLGDKGQITMTFSGKIVNGPGADFAVFENSFNDSFLELARVDVSSDGVNFVRFPAISFTQNPVGSFGSLDASNIEGLAGKYRQGIGTQFDLDTLKNVPGIDVNNVKYVRIVDIKGDGSEFDDYPAAFGGPYPIYDPYPTTGSGGFDLDAVGVTNFVAAPVPEPEQLLLLGLGLPLVIGVARRRRRLAL